MSATREKIRPLAVAQARAGVARASARTRAPEGILIRFPVERVAPSPARSLPALVPESAWGHLPAVLAALICGAGLAFLLARLF